MALVVHKYGGASMGSTKRIKNVARRVAKWHNAGILVGAVIPHVTPDALCDAVQIPIPSLTESAAMQVKCQRLCDLEAQAVLANRRAAEIVDSLWRPEL